MSSAPIIIYLLLVVAFAVWVINSIQATPDVIELIEMDDDPETPTQLFDQEAN